MSVVRVVAIAPFWRYAVGPTAAHSPAIPYYRLGPAIAFFEETKRELPWAGVILYKRRGIRGIEVMEEYAGRTGWNIREGEARKSD